MATCDTFLAGSLEGELRQAAGGALGGDGSWSRGQGGVVGAVPVARARACWGPGCASGDVGGRAEEGGTSGCPARRGDGS